MPCFPRKQPRVIKPQETEQPKTVIRYGETNIRHVDQPMRLTHWKKGLRGDPNAGRALPEVPREPEHQPQRLPSGRKTRQVETEYVNTSTPRPQQTVETDSSIASSTRLQQRSYAQPVSTDFFISVPIFNETMTHSYRKKNEFVYIDRPDDEISLYHQSLSRGSSLRDLRHTGQSSTRRPPSGQPQSQRRRPTSAHRGVVRVRRRRPMSGSEASFNTFSSRGTYGYESETFEEAKLLQRKKYRSRLSVDSDDEDNR